MKADFRSKVLWWAVRRRLKKDQPKIIAVTGSIAKTSTKELIGCVLTAAFPGRVRVSFGNLNSFLGVPLGIFGFRLDFYERPVTWQWLFILGKAIWLSAFSRLPQYLVLELGVDQPGDMKALGQELALDIAVVTLVGPAHLQNFPSFESYAREKALISRAVKNSGYLLLNRRDPSLNLYQGSAAKIIQFDCPVEVIAPTVARTVGRLLAIEAGALEEAIEHCPLPSGRLNKVKFGRYSVINDSYNANPLSMKAALAVLGQSQTRKVAVLGEMRELGDLTDQAHREIGQIARQVADLVIGVGEKAKLFNSQLWFANSTAAAEAIFSDLKDNDTILIKGSHALAMDKIVEAIKNHELS